MVSPGELILLITLLLVLPFAAIGMSFLLIKYILNKGMGFIIGRLPVFIADRYLFSRQNRGAINIITFISVLGITYVTYVLIVILSVFNGFQGLIEGMYTAFDPDIKIEAARGKTLVMNDSLMASLAEMPEIRYISPVVQDKAMLTYYDKQYMVEVKGVKPDYLNVSRLDTLLYEGDYKFQTENGFPVAVLGGSVAYFINARISDRVHPMKLWASGNAKDLLNNPEEAVRTRDIFAGAYFKVQMEYDTRYILADFALVQDLFDLKGKVTSYDIALQNFDDAAEMDLKLQAILGDKYNVKTWYEQHEALFNVMKNEKLVAYLILTLMLLIATVNIIGGLSMIVVEKTRDIAILRSMGTQRRAIRRIFMVESIFVGGIGGIAGMICATIFSYIHLNFGVIRINGGESFQEIEFFPLAVNEWDYLLTFGTVFALSMLAGLYPSARAAQTNIVGSLRK